MSSSTIQIKQIPRQEIHIGQRMRQAVEQRVEKLADSVAKLGIQVPVSVIEGEGGYTLVAGLHRLEACRRLGIEQIPCIVMEGGEIDAQLWEVDENLMRSELSPIERAAHLKRRKQLWERKSAESGEQPPEPKEPEKVTEAFVEETAEVTGETKATVNRDLRRADSVEEAGYSAESLVGTALDKGCELDALCKLEAEERRELIDRAVAGEKVTARQPRPEPSLDKQVDKLIAAFEKLVDKLEEEQRLLLAREVLKGISDEQRRELLAEFGS
jgi:ribosome-associated translation inhibitor RaiA